MLEDCESIYTRGVPSVPEETTPGGCIFLSSNPTPSSLHVLLPVTDVFLEYLMGKYV